jgi:hypothetical protein
MRVSFDSNAWETIFGVEDTHHAPIRAALMERRLDGFICAAAFRIEAIRKKSRPTYFAQPHMEVRFESPVPKESGRFNLMGSMGPDNSMHPGLPLVQAGKLQRALATGITLMYGENWMGLPEPPEIRDRSYYVHEEPDEARTREERQLWASAEIADRGVGKAAFDDADGWTDRRRTPAEERQLIKACAEWADGELVAAHIAYRNDAICTNDFAKGSGRSIFDAANRAWLAQRYGVTFMMLADLIAKVTP